MTELEEWRIIPGTDGFYEASNVGRVRSWVRPGGGGGRRRRADHPHMLRPHHAKRDNRPHVCIRIEGRMRPQHVQVLVALAFIGPRPPGHEVCHYDGNPANNLVENLRYDTRKGNRADMARHGTRNWGTRNGQSKLTEHAVLEIRAAWAAGTADLNELAELHGVVATTIWFAATGRTWKHVSPPGQPSYDRSAA